MQKKRLGDGMGGTEKEAAGGDQLRLCHEDRRGKREEQTRRKRCPKKKRRKKNTPKRAHTHTHTHKPTLPRAFRRAGCSTDGTGAEVYWFVLLLGFPFFFKNISCLGAKKRKKAKETEARDSRPNPHPPHPTHHLKKTQTPYPTPKTPHPPHPLPPPPFCDRRVASTEKGHTHTQKHRK
eukprot:TRINITY_DN405_c3_g1_i8.p2 TRINITY_DN405_c3_g1~~TRINITY_DN405_c3_g1_i8.p2  ORF type:complete len:179 (+),score=0.45 TRINITY_DN405_c3_g1_i8:103-639(+)